MEDKFKELCDHLKQTLKPNRFDHTMGVAYTAASLAMRYGADMKQAFLAGLLHDNAKNVSDDELLAFCLENNIPVNETEKQSKYLLHSKVGAYQVRNTFHIEDPEVESAVLYHTTGKPGMSLLEKIIFTADYMEPNRKEIPGLSEIRKIVFVDIDEAVYLILKNTLNYLLTTKSEADIDPMTIKTFEYYEKKHLQ